MKSSFVLRSHVYPLEVVVTIFSGYLVCLTLSSREFLHLSDKLTNWSRCAQDFSSDCGKSTCVHHPAVVLVCMRSGAHASLWRHCGCACLRLDGHMPT